MPGLPVSSQAHALIFEFLDRRDARCLAKTCKYAYTVSRQALLREPDEFAFFFRFAKLKEDPLTQENTEKLNPFLGFLVHPGTYLRQIQVSIAIRDVPEEILLFDEGSTVISLKRCNDGNFVVVASPNSSVETLFTVLFDFFKKHLSTKWLKIGLPSASLIKAVTNWTCGQRGQCESLVFFDDTKALERTCSKELTNLDTGSSKADRAEAVTTCLEVLKPLESYIDFFVDFSPVQVTRITSSIRTLSLSKKVADFIGDEEFTRWSPNNFTAKSTKLSPEAILAWILDTRRKLHDRLDLGMTFEDAMTVSDGLRASPEVKILKHGLHSGSLFEEILLRQQFVLVVNAELMKRDGNNYYSIRFYRETKQTSGSS